MKQVIGLLIATIAMMVLLLICSLITLYMVRSMFRQTYESFLYITEGEFDERNNQLSQIGDIMNKFKSSYYFRDFMGFKPQDNFKQNTNKTNKKYSNTYYLFRLVLTIFFTIIFYMTQILFSITMMLIFSSS